jgi:hypothetical protein
MYLSTLNDLKYYVESLSIGSGERLMIFVGDGCEKEVQEMINFLNSKNILFFGGIYPRVLVGDKSSAKGYIVNKVKPIYCSIVLPSLMRFNQKLDENEDYTAFVIGDGISSKFLELIDTVYNKLGNKVKYLGGGAGFYNISHKPCIFDNDGITMDVLYVCIIKSETKLAVEHGWNILKGPFTVTDSDGNILYELDGENAFAKYSEILEDETGLAIYKEDFFVCAKEYPFGIMLDSNLEMLVRDPVGVNEDDGIIFIADIPNDCNLFVLTGNVETLLKSSLTIAEKCKAMAPKKYKPLLFECITRSMFLEENFAVELGNIQNRMDYTVEGAVAIGEIASKMNGNLVIHNKSTVLGLVKIE